MQSQAIRLYTRFDVQMASIRKVMEFTSEMVLSFYAQRLSNFQKHPYFSKLADNYLNRMQEFVYYNIKFRSKYDF